MLERNGRALVFECDVCDTTEDFDDADFDSAWSELRRRGWRCKKVGDDWVHGCPQHARSI